MSFLRATLPAVPVRLRILNLEFQTLPLLLLSLLPRSPCLPSPYHKASTNPTEIGNASVRSFMSLHNHLSRTIPTVLLSILSPFSHLHHPILRSVLFYEVGVTLIEGNVRGWMRKWGGGWRRRGMENMEGGYGDGGWGEGMVTWGGNVDDMGRGSRRGKAKTELGRYVSQLQISDFLINHQNLLQHTCNTVSCGYSARTIVM